MTIFQIIMLGASAYFAFKIYEHLQTLQDPKEQEMQNEDEPTNRTIDAFSIFDSSTLIQKADEEREKENLERALAIYSEANIKDPNNAEILFKMGYTLALQDRDTEALEYLFEAIKNDASNPFSYKEVSKIYEKMGDSEKAQQYNKMAVEIDENI